MARTLHLTSPLMHGDDVREAQKRLKGSNAVRQNFTPGPIDGRFGGATMRATKRAKYWLGYPAGADGAYDDRLKAYLAGKTLPVAYKLRRRARLRRKPTKPLREQAFGLLAAKVGTKESPAGSNRVWASVWYGLIGPWCAMAVTWAYVTAGSKSFLQGHRYAYVPYIVHDARAGVNGLAVTTDPKQGDLVCYDWDGYGVADHVGLFDHWTHAADTFLTVEGNTAVGNDSNGGEVMQRTRTRSGVQCFVHVSG